jgi:hypothetical protein
LQRRATGGAAFTCAMRADVSGIGHQLTAMRARLEFFFKG